MNIYIISQYSPSFSTFCWLHIVKPIEIVPCYYTQIEKVCSWTKYLKENIFSLNLVKKHTIVWVEPATWTNLQSRARASRVEIGCDLSEYAILGFMKYLFMGICYIRALVRKYFINHTYFILPSLIISFSYKSA